jgi:predicted RNase H-like HicB family nuclease
MPEDVERYLHLPYVVEVIPESTTDGMLCYRASHPELPGCMAHGETPGEALDNLEDAKRLYIETLVAKGLQVPRPTAATGVVRTFAQAAIWTVVEAGVTAGQQKLVLEPA